MAKKSGGKGMGGSRPGSTGRLGKINTTFKGTAVCKR